METYLKHIEITKLYDSLQSATNTQQRYEYYYMILSLLSKYPKLKEFWAHHPKSFYYVNKITKIKDFDLKVEKQNDATAYAYIALLVKQKMIKVGKTERLEARLNELNTKYGATTYLEVFSFSNVEDAYIMEVILHKYFKEQPQSIFIPQDRFDRIICSDKDLAKLRKAAQKIPAIDWFAETKPKKLQYNQLYRKKKFRER